MRMNKSAGNKYRFIIESFVFSVWKNGRFERAFIYIDRDNDIFVTEKVNFLLKF